MSENKSNDPRLEQLKVALDQQAEELDAATLSRLRQARSRAVDTMQHQAPRLQPPLTWAAGFATIAALSVTLMLFWPGENQYTQDFVANLADTEILADEDGIEFYDELDFYIWLEQQQQTPGEV